MCALARRWIMTNYIPTKFPIDHSARFYPIIATKKAQSMFCMGAKLVDDVDKELLEQALNDTLNRYPSYKVRLKRGYAWHYFERNDDRAKVFDLPSPRLNPIDTKATNGYQFRLSCLKNDIRLDIFHALTDGNGAINFLKSIILRYRQLQGVIIDNVDNVISVNEEPTLDEMEDSFSANYQPIPLKEMDLLALAGKEPHHINGKIREQGYTFDLASANAQDILSKAKEIGVSFTAYTVGMLAYSIENVSYATKPLALMVPVNLRNIFQSNTHRNFVTFIRIIITPNTFKTVEEYAIEVQSQLKEKASKRAMTQFISTTVKAQKNILLKIVPLCVKAFFIKLGRLFMKSRQTIICSNLGALTLDSKMGVEEFSFNLNISKNNTQNVGIVTLNQKTTISFTRLIEQRDLPMTYFNTLRENGIEVRDC